MFSFFKSKKTDYGGNFSFLNTDIHSHLIPGIDDGSPDIETSLSLINNFKQLGYQQLVTTPHVLHDYYPNSRDTILQGLEKVHKALQAQNIDIKINAAAEYYLDEYFESLLKTEPLLTITDNEVLVEMSFMAAPINLHQLLFETQAAGYHPIIAHPERYRFYHEDFDQYHKFKELGYKLQLNALSLTGHYGKHVKHAAHQLLENNLIDYLGTDLHSEKHARMLQQLSNDEKLMQLLENYSFENEQIEL